MVDIMKKIKKLHREGWYIELGFSYLNLSKKEDPYYSVVLYKNFVRGTGMSEESIEDALEKALNQWHNARETIREDD